MYSTYTAIKHNSQSIKPANENPLRDTCLQNKTKQKTPRWKAQMQKRHIALEHEEETDEKCVEKL